MVAYHHVTRKPALFLVIFALAGTFLGIYWPWSWWIGVGVSLVFVVIFFRVTWLSIINFLLLVLLVTAWASSREVALYHAKQKFINQESRIWYGVVRDVMKKESGALMVIAALKPDEDADITLVAQIKLIDALSVAPLYPGSVIRFRGVIRPFLKQLSPVHFDQKNYALRSGLDGHITLADSRVFFVSPKIHKAYFASMRMAIRTRILSIVTPHEGSLLLALLIGDTQMMSDEQEEIYRMIGAQHLLAVSGLQVTLLGALCFFILQPLLALGLSLRYCHFSRTLAALITIGTLFWYVGVAGFSSSSLRAFLMTTCLLLPHFIARKIDVIDALLASFLVMILWMPLVVLDLGFWLSYAAVFGLVMTYPMALIMSSYVTKTSWALKAMVTTFCACASAFVATFPIVAWFFGSVAPFGMVANFFLVPLASMLQIFAVVLAFSGWFLSLDMLVVAAAFFSNVIEILAGELAGIFGQEIILQELFSWWLLVIFLASLGIAFLGLRFFKLATFMAVFVGIMSFFLKQPAGLRATVMAVGQGDATLFSLPNEQHILIDAAGQPYKGFDPGERIVVPTLQRKGVKALDVLIISHPDPDHILGAFAVLDAILVKEIWHSGYKSDHPLTKKLIKVALEKNIPLKTMPDLLGTHHFGDVAIEVLAPNTKSMNPYFDNFSANDNSLVVRIAYGQHALLWPGDLEKNGEASLLKLGVDLKADIVKAPHHGSKTSSTKAFIDAVSPRHVIYCSGVGNRFGFPHQEVVARYDAYGRAQQWNTAQDGEITISLKNDDLHVKGFLSR